MSSSKKSTGKQLQDKLTFSFPSIAMKDPDRVREAFAFCEPYKAFLNNAKT